jgi:WD40 repeat protein
VKIPAFYLLLFLPVSLPATLRAAPLEVGPLTHKGPVSYAKHIAPVFKKSCVACHNASKAKAKLNLEDVPSMMKGSSDGPVLVPGKADESLLFLLAAHREEEFMPPPGNKSNAPNLNPEQLALLKLWIDQGAKDDDTLAAEREVKFSAMSERVKAIYSVALSPDNQYAAVGRGNRLFVYDLATGELSGELSDPGIADKGGAAHLDIVGSLAFNHDGLLASGGFRTIKLWRRPEGVLVETLEPVTGVPRSAVSASTGEKALVGEESGLVRLYMLGGKGVKTFQGHAAAVTGVGFGSEDRLVTASLDKFLKVWTGPGEGNPKTIELPSPIHSMVVGRSGKLAACGCEDGVIRLVDLTAVAAGQEVKAGDGGMGFVELKGHQGAVVALRVFDGEGGQLLSAGADSTLRHWKINVSGGEQVKQIGNGSVARMIAVSSDGSRFASVSGNDTLKLWDGASGKLVIDAKTTWRAMRAEKAAASALTVATKLGDERKKQFDAAEKKLKTDLETVKKAQETEKTSQEARDKKMPEFKAAEENKLKTDSEVKAQEEAKVLAEAEVKKVEAGKADAQAQLKARSEEESKAQAAVKAASGEEEKTKADSLLSAATDARSKATEALKGLDDQVKKTKMQLAMTTNALKTAQDAAKKAADEHTKQKKEFDEVERKYKEAVRNREVAGRFVTRAEEAKGLAQGKLDAAQKALESRKAESEEAKKAAATAGSVLGAVEFSEDGSRVLASGDDGNLYSWAAKTGLPSRVINTGPGASVALCRAGKNVLSVKNDKSVKAWDLAPGWSLERTIGKTGDAKVIVDRVNSIAFSPDGNLLASGSGVPSRSGAINVWQVKDGKEVCRNTDSHSDTISAIAFSPDGSRIATSATDRFVKVFKAADASLERAFEGHTNHVLDVSWRADGLALASAGADHVVKVWDFEAGTQKQTVKGHSKAVSSVDFVGITETLLTGSGDKSVRLANQPLPDGGTFIHAAESSRDGSIIAAGGEDSLLRVWTAADKKLLFKLP